VGSKRILGKRGVDAPTASATRVAVERIDYWESPTSRIVRLVQAVKAVVTREAVDTPRKTLDGSVPG
jgi:hypothetical protein